MPIQNVLIDNFLKDVTALPVIQVLVCASPCRRLGSALSVRVMAHMANTPPVSSL